MLTREQKLNVPFHYGIFELNLSMCNYRQIATQIIIQLWNISSKY